MGRVEIGIDLYLLIQFSDKLIIRILSYWPYHRHERVAIEDNQAMRW